MQDSICYISEASKKVQVEPHVLRYWEEDLGLSIGRNEMGHRFYTAEDIERFQRIRLLKEQGLQLKAIRIVLQGGGAVLYAGKSQTALRADCGSTMEKKEPQANLCVENDEMENGTADSGQESGTQENDTKICTEKNDLKEKNDLEWENDSKRENYETLKFRTENDGKTSMQNSGMEHRVEDMIMKKAKKYMVTMAKGKEAVIELPREEAPACEVAVEDEKAKKAARLQYLLQHMVTEAVRAAGREMCTEIKESILKELDYQFRQQEEREEAHWKQEEEHYRKIDEMIRQRRFPKERFGRGKKTSP